MNVSRRTALSVTAAGRGFPTHPLFVIHAEHEWNVKELAAVYLCVYVSLIFTGAGEFSLDRLFFKRNSTEAKEDAKATN